MTPRRLAWLAMVLGAVAAGALRGFDASHELALLAGAAVAGAVGLGWSAAAAIIRGEE